MYNECEILANEIIVIKTEDGDFFDFSFDLSSLEEFGLSVIIDYRYFDRDLIISEDNNKTVKIGDVKKKNEVKSVYELRSIFEELVWYVQQLFCQSFLDEYASNIDETQLCQALNDYFTDYLRDEDMEFLLNQLVFEVLYSNYCEADSKKEIKLSEYCAKYFHYFSGDKWERYNQTEDFQTDSLNPREAANKMITRYVKRFVEGMNKPEFAKALEKMGTRRGVDFKNFSEILAKSKNLPKKMWDLFFLNSNKNLITSRQFKRNIVIESLPDRKKFVREFNAYDKYVETVITPRRYDDISKEYVRQSMDFYFLETHSRLDFMYKLAEALETLEDKNEELLNPSKIRFLIEPYSTYVYCPFVKEDEKGNTFWGLVKQVRDYNPIILTEKSSKRKLLDILRKPDDNPFLDDEVINFYRAKVLELFKYHHVFVSDNYKEIADFIRNNCKR
jgi:hypothetical protein